MYDALVVGAGPVGLACAIEAQRERLQACIIEKGSLVNSIVGYPARMEFFSTPDLIEIGGYPFPIQGYKPTREEAVEYYRGVAAQEKLDIRLYERVSRVAGEAGHFVVTTDRVIHRVGVISKHGVEIPLDRINTVFFHQSIFERLIGAGDLGIESAGERGSETFEDVRKPAIVQNEIYRQMEANNARMYSGRMGVGSMPDTGPAAVPDHLSVPQQIEKLDELRQRGVLTEAEFAEKKAELLKRM